MQINFYDRFNSTVTSCRWSSKNVLLKNCINIILIQPINKIFVPQFSYNSNLVVNKISLRFKTMLFTNISYFIFVVWLFNLVFNWLFFYWTINVIISLVKKTISSWKKSSVVDIFAVCIALLFSSKNFLFNSLNLFHSKELL